MSKEIQDKKVSENDVDRLYKQIELMFDTRNSSTPNNVEVILFNINDLYARCKVQSFSKREFVDRINDVLSGTHFCHKHGLWVVTEVEAPIYVVIRLYGPSKASLEVAIQQQVDRGHIHVYQVADKSVPKSLTWELMGLMTRK